MVGGAGDESPLPVLSNPGRRTSPLFRHPVVDVLLDLVQALPDLLEGGALRRIQIPGLGQALASILVPI